MARVIYGLNVDFIREHEHYMVLSATSGQKQMELSDFQLRMMTANRIPQLLELRVESRNGKLSLYYEISGKRMVSQGLRLEPITMRQYFAMLLQVATVLDDSKTYMLQPGRYVLNEDYIFYGRDMDDLYFTYIPKLELDGRETIAADLQQLAAQWIHRVGVLEGSGFQLLTRYLQEETFSLAEWKKLVCIQLDRLGGAVHLSGRSDGSKPNVEIRHKSMEHEGSHQAKITFGIPEQLNQQAASGFGAFNGQLTSDHLSNPAIASASVGASPSRRKLITILGLIVVLCFVWRWYAENPETQKLYISSVATVLLGAAAIWAYRRQSNHGAALEISVKEFQLKKDALQVRNDDLDLRNENQHAEDSSFLSKVGLNGSFSGSDMPWSSIAAPDYSRTDSLRSDASLTRAEPASDWIHTEPPSVSGSDLSLRTTLLSPSDATVLLSATTHKHEQKQPFLETERDGVKQRIPLTKDRFVIGRKGGEADWKMELAGVSRLHAEITKEGEEYAIKDLGSRNGTFVNDESLVPYRVHPLQEGDIVKMASIEFIFQMGN